MNKNHLDAAPAIDPLGEVVAAQAGAGPAAAPNIAQLIADEHNPKPAELFDPSIHETDPATGGPAYNVDGSLRKKRGRRPGQKYDSTGGAADDPIAIETENEPKPITAEQALAEAKLCSAMVFSACTSVGGDEWEPEPEERDGVQMALAEYIRTTGGIGLPPWAAVALAFGSYAARRTRVGEWLGLKRAESASRRLPPSAADDDELEPEPPIELRTMPDPVPLNPNRGTARMFRPAPVARDVA